MSYFIASEEKKQDGQKESLQVPLKHTLLRIQGSKIRAELQVKSSSK